MNDMRLLNLVTAGILLQPFALAPFASAQAPSASAQAPSASAKMDARQIVQRSLAVADRSWAANHTYTFIEKDETSHFDSQGQIRSTDVEVSRAIVVNGDTFEQTVSQNGKPPTPEKVKKEQELLRKRQNATPEEQAARLNEAKEDRAFIGEVPDAFNFRLIGEESVDGRPAYILEALPRPGYHAHSKYGKMFSKVNGKLWIDKQDFGWVKVEAHVTEPFSMGFILARIQPGTQITLEQTRVADGIWLPRRVEFKADAKILFLKDYRLQDVITYSDYKPTAGSKGVPGSTFSRSTASGG